MKSGVTYANAPATALSRVVALRLHLNDSGRDNGPLRVIPGTHALGILSAPDIDAIVRNASPIDCVAASGGIVAMRPLLLHASSKAESCRARSVLHIEYADSLDVAMGLRLAIA